MYYQNKKKKNRHYREANHVQSQYKKIMFNEKANKSVALTK